MIVGQNSNRKIVAVSADDNADGSSTFASYATTSLRDAVNLVGVSGKLVYASNRLKAGTNRLVKIYVDDVLVVNDSLTTTNTGQVYVGSENTDKLIYRELEFQNSLLIQCSGDASGSCVVDYKYYLTK